MNKKPYIEPELQVEIQAISSRFKGFITSVDIINWLDNFSKNDWAFALYVLEKTEFLTGDEILECFNDYLNQIISQHPKKELLIIPANEEFGKSATAMTYYITKTDCFRKKKARLVQRLGQVKREIKPDKQIIVLIDDFLGTGRTLEGFVKQYIPMFKSIGYTETIWIASAYMMNEAKVRLENLDDKIKTLGQERFKCFSPHGSAFGNQKKALREFSFQSGKDLFIIHDNKTGSKTSHPLGYENSQSLVAFSHTTPNNSLPILWASSNLHHPIFPRSTHPRIDRMKLLRKESSYWLYHARKLGFFELVSKTDEKLERADILDIDIRFIAVLKLLKQKRPIPTICQYLGILEQDYLELIELGNKKGILNKDSTFTEKGKLHYAKLLQEIKMLKSKKRRAIIAKNDKDIYVPKTFRGRA